MLVTKLLPCFLTSRIPSSRPLVLIMNLFPNLIVLLEYFLLFFCIYFCWPNDPVIFQSVSVRTDSFILYHLSSWISLKFYLHVMQSDVYIYIDICMWHDKKVLSEPEIKTEFLQLCKDTEINSSSWWFVTNLFSVCE